jgi:hypothetical protein
MDVFRKRAPSNLIPLNPDNATTKDWVVLLEAGTIVGPSPVKLRIARSMLEKKIVKRYGPLLNVKYFLEVEGYDPRIHAVYFCPQLYKYDQDNKLVPLQGDEIGEIIAKTLVRGVIERRPWYEPSEKLPNQPIINVPSDDFDTLVVEMPSTRTVADKKPADKKPLAVVENRN